jgi:hypothetical protein
VQCCSQFMGGHREILDHLASRQPPPPVRA